MNIIRVLVALSLGLLFACGSNLDSTSLPLNKQFVMADNLMCTIKHSSDKKEIGKKIALMGLTTTQPKAKFESGTMQPQTLTGFYAISRERLKELTDVQLRQLVQSDELELIYNHIQSMVNFEKYLRS